MKLLSVDVRSAAVRRGKSRATLRISTCAKYQHQFSRFYPTAGVMRLLTGEAASKRRMPRRFAQPYAGRNLEIEKTPLPRRLAATQRDSQRHTTYEPPPLHSGGQG